jgi:hypothetical protein
VGQVASRGKMRNVHKILVGKPKGKTQVGGPSHKWVNKIRMESKETGRRGCGMISSGSE